MPVKRKITELKAVYFITIRCHQQLSLIEQTKEYDLVYKNYLESDDIDLTKSVSKLTPGPGQRTNPE